MQQTYVEPWLMVAQTLEEVVGNLERARGAGIPQAHDTRRENDSVPLRRRPWHLYNKLRAQTQTVLILFRLLLHAGLYLHRQAAAEEP